MPLVMLLACARPVAPLPEGAPDGARPVELVLDRGRFDDGGWVSEPVGDDALVEPAVALERTEGSLARAWATLSPGDGVARVRRACGAVEVPYRVGAERTVLLPYPACGDPDAPEVPGGAARLGRHEVRGDEVARVQALGLLSEVPPPAPGEEDGPARWITLAEARAYCAWWGGRLPTRAEWAAAREGARGSAVGPGARAPVGEAERRYRDDPPHRGPAGHEDLDGNVEEWLDDGTVAGGGWQSGAPGEVRDVPDNARTEGIGLRCAW